MEKDTHSPVGEKWEDYKKTLLTQKERDEIETRVKKELAQDGNIS